LKELKEKRKREAEKRRKVNEFLYWPEEKQRKIQEILRKREEEMKKEWKKVEQELLKEWKESGTTVSF
jgi:hypothetical protein